MLKLESCFRNSLMWLFKGSFTCLYKLLWPARTPLAKNTIHVLSLLQAATERNISHFSAFPLASLTMLSSFPTWSAPHFFPFPACPCTYSTLCPSVITQQHHLVHRSPCMELSLGYPISRVLEFGIENPWRKHWLCCFEAFIAFKNTLDTK